MSCIATQTPPIIVAEIATCDGLRTWAEAGPDGEVLLCQSDIFDPDVSVLGLALTDLPALRRALDEIEAAVMAQRPDRPASRATPMADLMRMLAAQSQATGG